MTIAALPENTVCAITSSLVLHDAISVVKELIDNSLDAHATNILIEISLNALDIIQVKDNGSGIDLEDRQLLSKRGYTSKIRTLEDLAELGGTSLGFRGEALASAAELSESLSITTRVEGETVGTLLKFDAKGKLISSSSASHGTGTTVKILNFLHGIPVRQQACQKKAPRIIAGIKQLLFDYAFARPTTRFQYKVLKSRADYSGNWSFAPSPNAVDLNLTLSKIVGKDIVKHCKHESNMTENGQYTLNALVTADIHLKSTGSDQFISVDGRPLNSNGNLMKDLNKIYKSYARNLLDDHEMLPRRLFLAVRLTCPKGSYDINIEPTKDEVMFEDAAVVTQLFEGICKRVYGEVTSTESAERSRKADNATRKQKPFEVLLARRPPLRNQNDLEGVQTTPRHTNSVENFGTTQESSSGSAPESLASISDAETNYIESPAIEQGDSSMLVSDAQEGGALMHPEVMNPFVLAKLNTRVRPRDAKRFSLQSLEDELQGSPQDDQVDTPRDHSSRTIEETSPQREAVSGTSMVSNDPILVSRMEDTTDTYESSQAHSFQQLPLQVPLAMSSRVPQVKALSPRSTALTRPDLLGVEPSQSLAIPFARSRGTGSVPGSLRRSVPQKPFRTPLKKSTQTTLSSGTETISPYPTPDSSSKKPHSTLMITKSTNSPPTTTDHISELDDIMEFEHRKRAYTLQHRSQNQVPNKSQEKLNSPDGVDITGDDFDDADVPSVISSKALYEARFNSSEDAPGLNTTPETTGGILWQSRIKINGPRRPVRDVAVEANAVPLEEDISIENNSSPQTKLMHPNDPRALLIRNQSHAVDSLPTNRQSRARVAKLPFESIIADIETYEIHAFLDQRKDINTINLAEQHRVLNTVDGYYAHCGKIKHAMDDLEAGDEILETCKARALQLMQEQDKQVVKPSQ